MKKSYTWEESRDFAIRLILKFHKNDFDYRLLFILPVKTNSKEHEEQQRISDYLFRITERIYPHLSQNFSEKYVADEIYKNIIHRILLEDNYVCTYDETKSILESIKAHHGCYSYSTSLVFPVTNILVNDKKHVDIKGIQLWNFQEFYKKIQTKYSIEQKIVWETGVDAISTVAVLENNKEMRKAYSEGLNKVNALLDAFQFCNLRDVRRKDVCSYSLWLGPNLYEQYILMANSKHQFGAYNVLRDFSMGRIFLPLKNEELLQKKKFSTVFDLLISDFESLSEVQRATREAIAWYVKGERAKDYQTAFILYETSLEYVFKCGRGFSEKIAKGVARLFSENPQEIEELKKLFKKLYDKRSSILHGGLKNETSYSQLVNMRNCSNLAILFLLDNQCLFSKRDDIISYFNRKEKDAKE